MKSSIIIFLSLSLLALMAGCGDDNALSPPKDAHWVTIEFISPSGTTFLPAHLFYVSYICKAQQSNSDGGMDEIMGIKGFDQAYSREIKSETWQTRVAIEGGGFCQWRLNSVKVSFKLNNDNPLVRGKNNIETNYIFDFGDYGLNNGYGTGLAKYVDGNLDIKTNFFPMISINHMFNETSFKLFGGDTIDEAWKRRFRVSGTSNIVIAPTVHINKVVTLESPIAPPGNVTATYPDGSKEEVNGIYPDYEKLLSMK